MRKEKFQGKKYEVRMAKYAYESFARQDGFVVDKKLAECIENLDDYSSRSEEDGKEYYFWEFKSNDLYGTYTIFFCKHNDKVWILGIVNRSFRRLPKKSLKEFCTLYGYTWPPILE